ncbi:hypothetical protein HBH96_236510 [Parastagonospora nodorum]|nr:hypothetical protein HBH55_101090 [Parastagonospora nodorum]KAH4984664.1 hypothetical protein HBI76_134830 [Parastagonospora nodorum]KAH5046140.1 hypothetical protein HBH96_236510 [Parastagonospora nodorum]KAH5984197.1 hypothetical protein HBI84_237660 [Parastagonospora nodorum]KAH6538772.1 hypothetical protein HBI07_119960 [Parastagonospora nodorum]
MAVQQRTERSAEKQDLGSAFVDVEGFGLAAATSQWGKYSNVQLNEVTTLY